MKTIIYSILFIFISINTQAQTEDPDLIPFIGNWQWVDGNKTFTVEIFQAYDDTSGYHLEGHYKMEETINDLTNIVYKSNRLISATHNYYLGPVIYAKSYDGGISFGGSIVDNVLFGDGTYTVKRGQLDFVLQDTTPVTAIWKVEGIYGTRTDSEPANFIIPTDIILTKVD